MDDAAWSLIPSYEECAQARAELGWSVEELAQRAGIPDPALVGGYESGDLKIGGPGLLAVRRVFEIEGIDFWSDGMHRVARRGPRPFDLEASLAMITVSFIRFGEMHAARQMPN